MAVVPPVETCVRLATAADAGRVLNLVDGAVRCYMPYGQEDLDGLATLAPLLVAVAALLLVLRTQRES